MIKLHFQRCWEIWLGLASSAVIYGLIYALFSLEKVF